jgi:hypothetical protein
MQARLDRSYVSVRYKKSRQWKPLLAEEVAFACCIEVSRANGSLAVGTITGEVVGIPSPPRDFAKLNLAKKHPRHV